MKITCLVENSGDAPGLTARHGLCLFMETRDHTLLFDMGPDHTLIHNARNLGIDLAGVDLAFLSHGHRDHGGGLAAFRAANPRAEIFMAEGAADRFYARLLWLFTKEIGLEADSLDAKQCRSVTADTRISDSLEIFTGFDSDGFVPRGNKNLYRQDARGKKAKDDFSHELALLVREEDKTILITGCSHSGIGNMVTTVLRRTGLARIDHVVGGFHLFNPVTRQTEPPGRLDLLAEELLAFQGTEFHTGHCTGPKAYAYLKNILKDRISGFSTGSKIVV